MHSFGYELEDGKKCVVHYDGDCTGRAIWTRVENNERIVEVEADIEKVQKDVAFYDMLHPVPRPERKGAEIGIGELMFPFEAIASAVESLAINRVTYLMEDKIYDMPIHELLDLEKVLSHGR